MRSKFEYHKPCFQAQAPVGGEATVKKGYVGTWRIKEMDVWDGDFIDLVAPGQIKIKKDGDGSLRFGAVDVDIDCKTERIGEQEIMAFTFEGMDEDNPCCGRGWATVTGSEMNGHLFFHLGDDSSFRAVRAK